MVRRPDHTNSLDHEMQSKADKPKTEISVRQPDYQSDLTRSISVIISLYPELHRVEEIQLTSSRRIHQVQHSLFVILTFLG
jgi:hypothetical protein